MRWVGSWPAPDDDRDWVLMGLLAILNVGSLFTTVLGARQLLPSPMAETLGCCVQAMLFAMLAGVAGRHAPVRKWLVIGVFAGACVYCSFFTYERTLGSSARAERQLATAQARHAELVRAVFADGKNEGERLRRHADALERQAADEARLGATTGQTGYGPRARQMRAEANAARLAAEQQLAVVERLDPLFTFDFVGLTPKEVFDRDLAAWQASPASWRGSVPAPSYSDYVDERSQVAFLAPVLRVRAGDPVATVSLLLAALVDGMAIVLGTAIERRRRTESVLKHGPVKVAGWVRDVRRGYRRIADAWADHEHDTIVLHGIEPVEFLTSFYEAIHPETGHVAFDGLRRREPQLGLAARILLDRLMSDGWIVKVDGDFRVDESRYAALTAWLAAQLDRARSVQSGGTSFSLELPRASRVRLGLR